MNAGLITKRRKRVLIIDDHPPSVELAGYQFGKLDWIVNVARTLDEGLALARAYRPDLIVCDLVIPGNGGLEFAKIVKADPALKNIPMILYTEAHVSAVLEAAAKAVGYVAVKSKPKEMNMLARELLDLLPK